MVLCTVIFVSREATSMIAMWIGSLSQRVSGNVLREIKIFHTNLIMSGRVKNGNQKFCKVAWMSVKKKLPVFGLILFEIGCISLRFVTKFSKKEKWFTNLVVVKSQNWDQFFRGDCALSDWFGSNICLGCSCWSVEMLQWFQIKILYLIYLRFKFLRCHGTEPQDTLKIIIKHNGRF